MCKISKFFKSLFGFKPSDPKRRGLTLFKSSHKQHNHDEAISADQGSVQSRPPSVVAKLMGLDALPDSATTNQKQEMGMTPISPPFYAVTSKGQASTRTVPFTPAKNDSSRSCHSGYSNHPNYISHTESSHAKVRSLSAPGVQRRSKYSNVKQNDDQHREAVGEPMKASYRGTQVSREVAMVPDFSEEIDYRQRPSSIQEKSTFLLGEDESHDGIYMEDSLWPVKHLQKTLKVLLNGLSDEDIYMVQPEGFVDPKHPRKVCKLQRSIYGLKQASRSWNKRFDEEIKKFGFDQNLDESCVYQKVSGSNVTFLILYVDDIIIMGSIMYAVRCTRPDVAFAQNLTSRFQQNPGELHWTTVKTFLTALLIANEPGVQMGARHYHRSNLLKVHTDNNLAYPFTKALPKGKLTQHARSMGLRLASSFM
ncbi:retrotransposon protein, putative, ty1-copia subclass [Tanacetum coccineum]